MKSAARCAESAHSLSACVTHNERVPERHRISASFRFNSEQFGNASKRRARRMATAGINGMTDLPLRLQLANAAKKYVPIIHSPRKIEFELRQLRSSVMASHRIAA